MPKYGNECIESLAIFFKLSAVVNDFSLDMGESTGGKWPRDSEKNSGDGP